MVKTGPLTGRAALRMHRGRTKAILACCVVFCVLVFWWLLSGPRHEATVLIRTPDDRISAQVIFSQRGLDPALAHYTEHLVWLNTMRGGRDADRHSNAWTNSDAVGYWLSGQAEDLTGVLSRLKGVFDPLELTEEFAAQERDIVLREYAYRMADNPVAQTKAAMNAFLFADNTLARPVIGTPDAITAFTYDQAKALHAETHLPENAVLVVTGDVSPRQLSRAITAAGWPDGMPLTNVLVRPAFELGPPATERFEVIDNDIASGLIWQKVVTLPAPVPYDTLVAQSALLEDILTTNLPGGIAGPLRFDAAVTRSFDLEIWPIDENNIKISFRGAPDIDVSLTSVERAFEAAFMRTANTGIPQATYDRVLARFEGFWPDWNDDEDKAEWMADYVTNRVSTLRVPLSEPALKRLEGQLSLSATNALLRQLNGEGRRAIAYIGPKDRFE